ncbi:hypothetical protein [Virgibacillus proomii]|uniref:hypothetical protein n=1 Tax=Virgibacillus proomii TaxID=84407 RepID=UPI001C101412|nr:hypothetical protein [Virgibacillus proomii]MBU5268118.1 hypothetical protein [Virgibacillus proomii]
MATVIIYYSSSLQVLGYKAYINGSNGQAVDKQIVNGQEVMINDKKSEQTFQLSYGI